ncbi:MAG: hypothetical protein K6G76_09125 [Lachnospiraceae bacterium]|nr:hypothetical protein [Lachnospiraceae bacterium]
MFGSGRELGEIEPKAKIEPSRSPVDVLNEPKVSLEVDGVSANKCRDKHLEVDKVIIIIMYIF